VPLSQRTIFRVGWSRLLEKLTKTIGRWDDVPDLPLTWTKNAGPYFGNGLAELVLDRRSAEFTLWHAVSNAHREDRLAPVASLSL
jgi:hypothetical protein